MRRQLATLILTAAIGPVLSGLLPRATAQVSPPAAGSAQAGTAAVGGGRGVPVKRVVLYTSGVGYFEHFGTVHGDASTVLSFKTDQINDVLKSLLPAGKSASLRVQEVHFDWQAVEILPNDATALLVYSQLKSIPQPVKDALNKAIQLKQAVTDADRDLAQVQQDKAELSAEQDRMRKNMQAVSAGTDYYKKLLNKMDGQETQFEQMETHEKQLVQEKQNRQKQLEDYLSSLTVG